MKRVVVQPYMDRLSRESAGVLAFAGSADGRQKCHPDHAFRDTAPEQGGSIIIAQAEEGNSGERDSSPSCQAWPDTAGCFRLAIQHPLQRGSHIRRYNTVRRLRFTAELARLTCAPWHGTRFIFIVRKFAVPSNIKYWVRREVWTLLLYSHTSSSHI